MYYINDNGDVAKVEQENHAKDLVKISVNGVFIDEWRKYDDFVKEFRGMGLKDERTKTRPSQTKV